MQRGLLLTLTGFLLIAGIAAWWWSGRSSGTSPLPAGGKEPGAPARTARAGAEHQPSLVAPPSAVVGEDPLEVGRQSTTSESAPDDTPPRSDGEVRLPDMADTTGAGARRGIATQPVVLFEHAVHDANFPGRSWNLVPGLTNAGAPFVDNEASSVKIPGGLLVTLFEGTDGRGARVALGAGTHNLAPYAFNDRVSSVRISRSGQDVEVPKGPRDTVLLYEHLPRKGGPEGKVWKLPLDEEEPRLFTAGEKHFAAHAASAAWVPLGVELTLFEQPDGRGPAMVMGPGFHELAVVGFNDRASSARVRRAKN